MAVLRLNPAKTSTCARFSVANMWRYFRPSFRRTIIANLGFERETANEVLSSGCVDVVSFAKHFIANPDLPERLGSGFPLAQSNRDTYSRGGAEPYRTICSVRRFGSAAQAKKLAKKMMAFHCMWPGSGSMPRSVVLSAPSRFITPVAAAI